MDSPIIRPRCNGWGIEVLLGVRHLRSGNLHVHALGPVHKWIVSLDEEMGYDGMIA